MEYVERQYQQYLHLTDHLERAAEALKVFQDRMMQDQEVINNLRCQLESAKKFKYEEEVATRRNLQEKLQKLKQLLQFNQSSEEFLEGEPDTKPKVTVPKLALSLPQKMAGTTSPNVAPRSKSFSDINITEEKVVATAATTPSNSSSYSEQDGGILLQEDKSLNSLRRRNTIANLKPFDPPLDLSIPQDALSQVVMQLGCDVVCLFSMQCRLCSCDFFRATQKAGWICLCGHTSIKHSNIAYKVY
jgi:hypothetical protein